MATNFWERAAREALQIPMLLFILALGAVLGVGVALCLKWLELSDAMANFVGGVAGATLGSALAVFAATAIASSTAHRERKQYAEMLLAEFLRLKTLWDMVEEIAQHADDAAMQVWEVQWPHFWHFVEMRKAAEILQEYYPLRPDIGPNVIVELRRAIGRSLDMVELFRGAHPSGIVTTTTLMTVLQTNISIWKEPVDEASRLLGNLARD